MTDKPWTDKQIYKAARDEWVGVLLQLWEAYNKQPNPKQLRTYINQLSSIPMGALEKAVSLLLREHKYNSVPTIAEIWDVLKRLNGGSDKIIVNTKPWVWRLMGEDVMPEIL